MEVRRFSACFQDEGKRHRRIVVYDCRHEKKEGDAATEKTLEAFGLDYKGFCQLVSKEFHISGNETFVLTTTDRTELDDDSFDDLQDGTTLHLLREKDQALSKSTEEHVTFLPHYDTLVRSGMYEYYASEGKNSLPYALAELIDNALSATVKNTRERSIEIRLMFDETLGKPAVIVLDNGLGMTSKQLNNWAVYRLSKFARDKDTSINEGYVRPDPVPRSLNSDISYFGVGGKQAVFYIGQSTRMITKAVNSQDVHELILSKDEFERKEKDKEYMYSGIILNRKPGDISHMKQEDERLLHDLIAEESGKESFTAVVITGIRPENIAFLKQDFHVWTRELARVYHYYIHGLNGNDKRVKRPCNTNPYSYRQANIQVSLREKLSRPSTVLNLRQVDYDMQSLYINATVDTFEFKALIKGGGTVEGVLRYHPFLYDRETYPRDTAAALAPADEEEEDDDNDSGVVHQARGKRPIFECYWNGRLIPYTTVSEFEWCARPKKPPLPAECYSRFSGVLFTDDRFQVSTNKLTFMDLELQLRNKDTIFTRVVNGQVQRVTIHKEFTQWLKSCHEQYDKQVRFLGLKDIITRKDVPTKKMQHPWATFSSIEWDGKKYTTGQYVKSQKTQPIIFGSVVRFLLYGHHDGDVYATGGHVEVAMEPKALYDEIKTIPITKIDKTWTTAAIKRNIDKELAKLPEKLKVTWPDGNTWSPNSVQPAGTSLGPLRVDIQNKKEELMSRLPSGNQGAVKKLLVELKVVWHGAKDNEEIVSHIAQHSAKWGYWFKCIESLNKLGKYTLCLNTVLNESNANTFAGKPLPSYKLQFTITEGSAESFVVAAVSSPVHVGVPFNIPLELLDGYGHPAHPPPDLKPVLKCSGLDVCYEGVAVSGTTFTIRSVKASGKVQNYHSKIHELTVVLPGLRLDSQVVKISLLPGEPHSLHVTPEDDPITLENGNSLSFNIEIHDEAGNITAHPKLVVCCKAQEVPLVATDCSSTGAGVLVTKPINLNNMNGDQPTLTVKFVVPSQKQIPAVLRKLKVVPSTRVSRIKVYTKDDLNLVLTDKDKIEWEAGGLLDNLYYKLYDEGGREVPLTAQTVSMIKVNWTRAVSLEDLAQGKLPNVKVQTLVKDERFFQVSYQNQNVSVNTSFSIVPRPDEAAQLKVTLSQNTVKMGQTLPGEINLELVDQYGNVTKTLTSACVEHTTVEAEGLDKSALNLTWQESSHSIVVTGVRFLSGTPGSKEIHFTCSGFVEHVRITVAAGNPAQLTLVKGPEQPLQVLNGHGIPTPFHLQLCDEWGNPSVDQRVVVSLKSSSTLKVDLDFVSRPVDLEGKAVFTVQSVSGPKGQYQLVFEGSFSQRPIPGPSVKITVIPNPNKAVSLLVEYDTTATFPAGGAFPVFSVTVVSDEGSPMTGFSPAQMLMFLSDVSGAQPDGAISMCPSKPLENERDDCFHFRDKVIPDQVGMHTIQFVLMAKQKPQLSSEKYMINVVANDPVKLAPISKPTTPVVSNSDVIAKRTLVENMTLRIMDRYCNPTGAELVGKVVVSIKSSSGDSSKDLPLFEGNTSTLLFDLLEGKLHITWLAIMENSPGQDGSEYILHFKPDVQTSPGSLLPLDPFELLFRFYNDAENQQKMSELSKRKDELKAAIAIHQDLFDDNKVLLDELTAQHQDASKREAILKTELGKRHMVVAQLATISNIDKVLQEKNTAARRIKNMPRRECSIPDHFVGSQDVLGKVGHLALVEHDAVAVVVSWHILGDMDCVITHTTQAARRIYDVTRGSQQVMALDSVYIHPNNRPLPHIRDGYSLFPPTGNPVYVRDLLIYPHNKESCEKVFKNILGDVILIDDLDSANHYRKEVVQRKMPCPTILTRQGERISGRGKFGGAQNKAPPIEKLRGQVFGAPLPQEYHTLIEDMDLLSKYRSDLGKKENAKKERDAHIKALKSPAMFQKEQKMEEMKKELKEIEKQLASTPRSAVKRAVERAGETSNSVPKRPRRGANAN